MLGVSQRPWLLRKQQGTTTQSLLHFKSKSLASGHVLATDVNLGKFFKKLRFPSGL